MNTRTISFLSILSIAMSACSEKTETDNINDTPEEQSVPKFQSLTIVPNEDVNTSTSLTCIAIASDEDGDILEISYRWLDASGEVMLDDSQNYILSPETVQPTDEIFCEATLSDDENTITEQTSITIINTPPVLEQVTLTPNEDIFSNTEMVCTATAYDEDLEEVSITFSWLRNNEEVDVENYLETTANSSTLSLSSDFIQPDDIVSCLVTVEDNFDGIAEMQQDISIQNTPPEIGGVLLSPSTPNSQESITCEAENVQDIDNDNVTLNYTWSINGIIQEETSNVLTGPFSVQDRIECSVSSNDGRVDGETLTQEVLIANTAPSLSTIEITPDQMVYADSTLQCSATGEDFDGENVEILYRWTDSLGTQLADSEYLDLLYSNPSVGEEITCSATVVDPHGAEDILTTSIFVENSLPQWTQEAIITGQPQSGNSIYCQAEASDINDGLLDISYAWTNDSGEVLSSSNVLFIDHNTMDVGDAITCTASTSDVQGESLSSTQNITIENMAPELEVSFSEEEYYSDSLVTCTASATDIEGHSIELSYRFFRMDDGVEVELGTEQTLQLSSDIIQPQDTLYCSVTATDEVGDQSIMETNSTIQNTQPQFTQNATISFEGDPSVGTVLTCQAEGTDIDGDVEISYSWKSGSTTLSTDTQWEVDGEMVNSGDMVSCTAFVRDGSNAVIISTDTVTIENMAPELEVSFSEEEYYSDSLVTCTASATDIEGHSIELSYRFFRMDDGVEVELGTEQTLQLSSDIIQPQDTLYCSVTATDEVGDQSTQQVAMVIASKLPQDIDVTFSYDSQYPIEGDELTCSYVEISSEHEIVYTRRWLVDGVEMTDVDGVPLSDESIIAEIMGEYECLISVSDGVESLERSEGVVVDSQLSSMQFSGNGYVQNTDALIPTGDWTISFWIYVDSASFGDESISMGIFQQWNEETENENNALQIHYVWNSGSASIEVENGGSTLVGSLPTATSQWVHVVVKRESDIKSLYIDGAWTAEDSSALDVTDNSEIRLGYANQTYLDGSLSQFYIWDEALSVDLIGEVYNNSISTSPILAYTSGTQQVIDRSGNNFHGEIINDVSLTTASPFSDSDQDGIIDKEDIDPHNEFIQNVVLFTYTGADQIWNIPEDQSRIIVQLWGAAGGGSNAEGFQHPGGAGGFVEAELNIDGSISSSLRLEVGQGGGLSSSGSISSYPNGGAPGLRSGYVMGGGGGRSAVFLDNGTTEELLAVAGGGGGAGGTGWSEPQSTSGGAGGEIGENGSALPSSQGCEGLGGTQTESPEQSCAGGSLLGPAGGYLFGGSGLDFQNGGNSGGGGGDGYYGGSAGALHAGGGGGSSYVNNAISESMIFTTSSDGISAPQQNQTYYMSSTAGGSTGTSGENGLIVIFY